MYKYGTGYKYDATSQRSTLLIDISPILFVHSQSYVARSKLPSLCPWEDNSCSIFELLINTITKNLQSWVLGYFIVRFLLWNINQINIYCQVVLCFLKLCVILLPNWKLLIICCLLFAACSSWFMSFWESCASGGTQSGRPDDCKKIGAMG